MEKGEKRQLTIRLGSDAFGNIEEMAKKEEVTKAELIRRALNFYQVKQKAHTENKRILLKDEKTGEEIWVI